MSGERGADEASRDVEGTSVAFGGVGHFGQGAGRKAKIASERSDTVLTGLARNSANVGYTELINASDDQRRFDVGRRFVVEFIDENV